MKALSVRAPWWAAILYCGKDIENRDWPTKFRGPVLLHASKWWQLDEVAGDWDFVRGIVRSSAGIDARGALPEPFTYRHMRDAGGCIVGKVEIVDYVSASDSPWFFGRYGFVLRNPVAFPRPIPVKGALGFFDVPDEVVARALSPADGGTRP